MNLVIESDTLIQHPAETRGVVISRVQTIRNTDTGELTTVRFWTQWETGRLVRVQ